MNKQLSRTRRGLKAKALIRKSGKIRLVVYRSSVHIYSQIVEQGSQGDKVLVSCSTNDKDVRGSIQGKTKLEQASIIGKEIAKKAMSKGLSMVAFDRNGFKYHGRIKALADGAREGGLEF